VVQSKVEVSPIDATSGNIQPLLTSDSTQAVDSCNVLPSSLSLESLPEGHSIDTPSKQIPDNNSKSSSETHEDRTESVPTTSSLTNEDRPEEVLNNTIHANEAGLAKFIPLSSSNHHQKQMKL
jgi:hypothetical protein